MVILFLVSRRYKKHLDASHREHHDNWNNRGNISDELNPQPVYQMAMKLLDTLETGTRATSPRSERIDEMYLPEDVQRVVDRVAEMRRQETRLPIEAYGSIRRKPLPAYPDGY